MSLYNNALILKQAFPNIRFTVSNYFPIENNQITLENTSEDDDSFEWSLDDDTTQSNNTIDRVVNLTPTDYGDLAQSLEISNTVGTVTLDKYIYPLPVPPEAYYEFVLDRQVSRVGESVQITLNNKYGTLDAHTVLVEVTDHETGAVEHSFVPAGMVDTFTINTRGIYDVEVQVTTGATTIYYKLGMILTINPALQARGSAKEYDLQPTHIEELRHGTPWAKIDGDNFLYTGNPVDPGDSVVIVRDTNYPEDSVYRLMIENVKGTAANPIVITIDQATPLQMGFQGFWGIILLGCEHVIIDGMGYQNIPLGINLHTSINAESEGISAVSGGRLSTECQIHNVEIHDIRFAGVFFKTDPDVNDPSTWRVNFQCDNVWVHNNYVHDNGGEGFYIGYFDGGEITKEDSNGVEQTYRAHELVDTKLYRNLFVKCGWDSLQANNLGGNSEIAYNTLIQSAFFGEFGQNTGMSISLEGSVHDNIIDGCAGNGIQFMQFGPLEFYNNLIYNLDEGVNCMYILSAEGRAPETNPGGTGENSIPVEIYNNNLIVNGKGSLLGAQNVVQHLGVRFRNNVIRHIEGFKFSGQEQTTLDTWETNSTDNIYLQNEDPRDVKIADADIGNYNIYIDSSLAAGAPLLGTQYDIRGYKNWTNVDKFYGCYASIIDPPADIMRLNSILINNGDIETGNPVLDVVLDVALGTPTEYRISDDPGFSGASWTAWVGPNVNFTIASPVEQTYTIYAQVRQGTYEPAAQSDTIDFVNAPLAKTVISFAAVDYASSAQVVEGSETINLMTYEQDELETNFALENIDGNPVGEFVVKPSELPSASVGTRVAMENTANPTLSGDTGPYQDTYFGKYIHTLDSQNLGNTGLIRLSGFPEAEYTINFYRASSQLYFADRMHLINIKANGTAPWNPPVGTQNTPDGITTLKGVQVAADGFLDIETWNDISNYFQSPGFNLIEIIPEVLDRSVQTYIVDLGVDLNSRQEPTPYNVWDDTSNVALPLNYESDFLYSTDNQVSTMKLVLTSDNWHPRDNGMNVDNVYTAKASRDGFAAGAGETALMEIQGCNDASTYTVRILNSRASIDVNMDITLAGVQQSINAKDNTNPLTWNNVSSTGGVIAISCVANTPGEVSRDMNFNVIEIIETT